MTRSQGIFAASTGATSLGTGSWLLTVDPAGFGLIVAGVIILLSNGYTWLQSRITLVFNRLRDKSASSALS